LRELINKSLTSKPLETGKTPGSGAFDADGRKPVRKPYPRICRPSESSCRALAGPSLLAMILYAKFALHQPLNRKPMRARAWICQCLADDVGASPQS
jgi:hypothetical protein